MFTQQQLNKLLFFDIETAGQYPSFEEFKAQDPDGAMIYAGKCDRMGYGDPADGYENKVSLFPEFGRIVCLSYGLWKNGEYQINTISELNEADLVKKIAILFQKCGASGLIPCGWNVKNFDIPWVYRKILMYNLQVPECVNTWGKKPWEVNIVDLKEWWKGFSNLDVTFEEAMYGLGLPSPKDEMHGGQVHQEYWLQHNTNGIIKYCEKDVMGMIRMTEKIHNTYYKPALGTTLI
jgi:hypothetical protein